MDETDLTGRMRETATGVDALLAALLADAASAGEIARPARLAEAMRYASLAGGKRLRPLLVVEAARLFGVAPADALRSAAAVECIHCYSLVHDDLPAMDDDDLRRGQPTTHRAYDEATAILVGDALLTLAFDILAAEATAADPAVRIALVGKLARAAGVGGMVGGQFLDLAAEGRFAADGRPLPLGEAEILKLQAMKTGALLTVSVEMGAILGGAGRAERDALRAYGHMLGQAFQVADDLLDVESDAATLGKATGKDREKGKATLVGLWGVDAARAKLARLVAEAEASLAPFGERADTLRRTARFVADRKN